MEEPLAMKQMHGGDDDDFKDYEEEPKKPKLDKYLSDSDSNLTDLFEKIIMEYINGNDPSKLLEDVKYNRITLMRAGLKAIDSGLAHLKISKNRIAYYLIKMIVCQNWKLVFKKIIVETSDKNLKNLPQMIIGIDKYYSDNKNKNKMCIDRINNWVNEMILNIDNKEILALLSEIENQDIIESAKKELMLIAREDVGENKKNAINAIAKISAKHTDIIRLFKYLLISKVDNVKVQTLHAMLHNGVKVTDKITIDRLEEVYKNTNNAHIKTLVERLKEKNKKYWKMPKGEKENKKDMGNETK